MLGISVTFKVNTEFETSYNLMNIIIPVAVGLLIFSAYKGGRGAMSKGSKSYKPIIMKNKIFFKDVAGMK